MLALDVFIGIATCRVLPCQPGIQWRGVVAWRVYSMVGVVAWLWHSSGGRGGGRVLALMQTSTTFFRDNGDCYVASGVPRCRRLWDYRRRR